MRRNTIIALAAFASPFVLMVACGGGDNTNKNGLTGGNTSTANGGAGGNGDGGDIFNNTSSSTGGGGVGGGCASQSATATLEKAPVDVIIVIDNSGSMGQEIVGVQDNINQNFATIIENSGVDYRVILIAQHGEALGPESVCIEAPLSGIPAGGCSPAPNQPTDNPPKFFHYSRQTASHNSLCLLFDWWDQPDEFGNHPNGWGALLREEAFKVFVEVTDDGVVCTSQATGNSYDDNDNAADGQAVAAAFDADLLALAPNQFGTAMERNYRWYSLIALENFDNNNPALPWAPTEPITTGECPTAADPGTGYQGLSILTEGLRFPLCEPNFYDVVFNEIAQGVIAGAQVSCNFPIPEPPPGETIDLPSVAVQYTPMGTGTPETFTQVGTAADCVPDSFYIDEMAGEIILCPDTCTKVQQDDAAQIDVVFQCFGSVD